MTSAEMTSEAESALPICENCGKALLGEHCYHCGQPTKGLVRHFSSILGDFFDTVLNVDSRVLRTLGPLLLKPGFLSLEYFSGRRVRYVTPMRLYLFLSVMAFFAVQASIEIKEENDTSAHIDSKHYDMAAADTPEQVRILVDASLLQLKQARKQIGDTSADAAIALAEKQLSEQAKQQIDYLKAIDLARASGKPLPSAASSNDELEFINHGKRWDPKTNPIAFAWLPDSANAVLNRRMQHARETLKAGNSEKQIVAAVFNVLPQTLFILMPVFAVLLKFAYWFKRRLYMEHLIVALHSHSFIAFILILMMAFSWLQSWLTPQPGFMHRSFGWAIGLGIVWTPVYLLLMQKRVYGQGWPMTLFKFGVLSVCYWMLLGIGLVAAILVGLLTL